MTTIAIDDRYTDEALKLLESLPKEAYKITQDPLREELQRRLYEIDNGEVELLPFDEEFWKEMDTVIDGAKS
ncbi:MAG: addiction module protein [Campylobacterales bacterium]